MEDDLQKNEIGRQLFFVCEKLEWLPQKNMEDDLQKKEKKGIRITKNEIGRQKKWKMTSKKLKNRRWPKKIGTQTNQPKSN